MAEPLLPDAGSAEPEDLYFVEPPEVLSRNVSVGVRLISAAVVTFFGAFVFSYVYLRERDTSRLWRPSGVGVPFATGLVVMLCIVAAAAVSAGAVVALRRLGEARWREAMALSQALALAALAVQCYQWATLGFGAGSCAYASVFVSWTGFFAGLALPCAIYWSQTALSTSLRHRRREPGQLFAVAGMAGGEGALRARLDAEARSLTFFWWVIAAIELVTFMLLYVAR